MLKRSFTLSAALIIILCFSGCGTKDIETVQAKNAAAVSEKSETESTTTASSETVEPVFIKTNDASETGTDSSIYDGVTAAASRKNNFGDPISIPDPSVFGLIDTGTAHMTYSAPTYTEGILLQDSYLYPAPSEDVYDTCYVYKGRTVTVLGSFSVQHEDLVDLNFIYTDEDWLLIAASDGTSGFIRAAYVGDASENTVEIETNSPYLIRSGCSYYFKADCPDNEAQTNECPQALWIMSIDEITGIVHLESYAGFECYVKNMDDLIPDERPATGRIQRGN